MFKYDSITLMIVALYCVAQISVVFGNANAFTRKWTELNVKSPETFKVAQEGLEVFKNSNNGTYEFAVAGIMYAAYRWESITEVHYAVLAIFDKINCLPNSDVNKRCVPGGRNLKYCWINKNQRLNDAGHVTIHCY
ncbi:Protein of unknown function [Cotesia congregata]|uniref:Cystatin domain-containing protein n=1 Tax=Cotesia congregata TaxID=51543 RepID=A0A8J2MBV7_COTCN|nr:Protein of unknown function [Cotesia congregata]